MLAKLSLPAPFGIVCVILDKPSSPFIEGSNSLRVRQQLISNLSGRMHLVCGNTNHRERDGANHKSEVRGNSSGSDSLCLIHPQCDWDENNCDCHTDGNYGLEYQAQSLQHNPPVQRKCLLSIRTSLLNPGVRLNPRFGHNRPCFCCRKRG
jgi:hypothetical protein